MAEPEPAPTRFVTGGAFVLDTPATPPTVWGRGREVLWAAGESLVIAAPAGAGKTTLSGQLVLGRIGLLDEVLGYPVETAPGRVLYLAMDRPRQIARAFARLVTDEDRQLLDDRLVVWQGPPPADFGREPAILARLCAEASADTVVIDSLKDAAVKLSDDEVGGNVNRAIGIALAEGYEVLANHHQRKSQAGARPTSLEDVYGSTWITAGAGSVVLLWGQPGDPIVEMTHLKQPAEPVGPLRVQHDHDTGTSRVIDAVDLLELAARSAHGLTVRDAARALFEKDEPSRNDAEKARRRLDRLVSSGQLIQATAPRLNGGTPPTVYRPAPQLEAVS